MPKKILVFIALVVSVSSYGFFTQVPGDSKITDVVNANFYCISKSHSNSEENLVLAFDLALGKERVWQVESENDEKGIEFSVLKFDRARCPLTYVIDLQLQFMGEKVKYSIATKNDSCPLFETANGNLNIVDTDSKEISFDINCHVKN